MFFISGVRSISRVDVQRFSHADRPSCPEGKHSRKSITAARIGTLCA